MENPKRKDNRLKDYDYSQNGYYFLTICTHVRQCTLSQIVGAGLSRPNDGDCVKIQLTPYGEIVEQCLLELPLKYFGIEIDKYIIMPNHIHLILIIEYEDGRENPAPTVGQIMGYFKYQSTKSINNLHNNDIIKIFQRGFHDRIIRDNEEYEGIWQYIDTNALAWEEDDYYRYNNKEEKDFEQHT